MAPQPEMRIAALRKTNRDELLLDVIAVLTAFVKSVNVGNNMNPDQVAQCANDIVDDYYFLSVDDLDLCFRMARKGQLSAGAFVRMDQPTVYEVIQTYVEKRQKAAIEKNNQEMLADNIYERFSDPETMKKFEETSVKLRDLNRSLGETNVKEKVSAVLSEPMKAIEKPAIMVQIEREWYELEKAFSKNGSEIWFTRIYNGSEIYFDKFYNLRFEELVAESGLNEPFTTEQQTKTLADEQL